MTFKYDIGDLVTFQIPYADRTEHLTGMITFRDKAGYKTVRREIQNSYYHILLPTGETHYSQREDRLASVAKANP